MRPIRRILVAIKDPQARRSPAAAKAIQLAQELRADVELFHALDAPVHVGFPLRGSSPAALRESLNRWRAQSLERLERVATRLRRSGVRVKTAVEWDYPAHEAVIRRAVRVRAGLIVADCHPGRHIAPGLLQLTDWELLRSSPVPVLVVKSARPYKRPAVLAALDPSHVFAKPAKLDDQVLRLGTAVASALHGALHVVHAYVPHPIGVPPRGMSAPEVTALILERAAASAKAGLERTLGSTKVPQSRRHLVAAHPINVIPEVARRTRSAIVVMGAVSRSGLKSLFIGNTAERVLDELGCDLLVVKPTHVTARVSRAVRGARLAVSAPRA
jgi:universal stress protein E